MKTLITSHKAIIKNAAIGIVKEFKKPINFMEFMADAIMALSRREVTFNEVNHNTSGAITFMRTILENWMLPDGDEVDHITKAINYLADFDSAENWRNVLTYIQSAVLVQSNAAGVDKEYYYEIRNRCQSLFEVVFALHEIEWEAMKKKTLMRE